MANFEPQGTAKATLLVYGADDNSGYKFGYGINGSNDIGAEIIFGGLSSFVNVLTGGGDQYYGVKRSKVEEYNIYQSEE